MPYAKEKDVILKANSSAICVVFQQSETWGDNRPESTGGG